MSCPGGAARAPGSTSLEKQGLGGRPRSAGDPTALPLGPCCGTRHTKDGESHLFVSYPTTPALGSCQSGLLRTRPRSGRAPVVPEGLWLPVMSACRQWRAWQIYLACQIAVLSASLAAQPHGCACLLLAWVCAHGASARSTTQGEHPRAAFPPAAGTRVLQTARGLRRGLAWCLNPPGLRAEWEVWASPSQERREALSTSSALLRVLGMDPHHGVALTPRG